jgi:hypothetical protein
MRIYIFIAILYFSGASFSIPGQYKHDISEAILLLQKEWETIQRVSEQYDCETAEALSIVFPEIIRYSKFKDFFETKALEQFYVLKGNSWADFSIGIFQMKPSFVEDLEYHVQHLPGLKADFQDIIFFFGNTGQEKRQERIERLKSFEWQLKYAFCYYQIIQKCYEHFPFRDDEHRRKFFATAYNFGFTRPFEEIEAWMDQKAFPYGKKFNTEQFAFSELSTAFYHHYFLTIEKTSQ